MKIEAFFSSYKNANEAAQKLKSEGFNNAYADLNEHYDINNNSAENVAGTSTAPSLSDLVLYSGEPTDVTDKSPLAAASPMVSGMGGFEEITDINYKVSVDTNKDNDKKATDILLAYGGDIKNPNLNLPERIKDLSLKNIDRSDLKI
jgi:hypothetical protein